MRESQEREEEAFEPERPGELKGNESSQVMEESAPQARSRFEQFARKALLWLVILLLAFAAGALVVYWYFYRPQSQELEQTRSQLQQAQHQIAELEVYQSQNEALREEQLEKNIQIYILGALSDVNAARYALATEDAKSARAALSDTGGDLRSLSNLVGPDQRSQLAAMQNRLQLALNEMDRDAFAAQSDLGVLEANLRQLEAALIPAP